MRMKFNRIKYKNISKKVVEIINNEEKFVLFSHKKPDGDAMGSVLTMYCLFKKMNKNVEVAWDDEVPYQFTFLPYSNILKKNIPSIDSNTVLISLDNSSKDLINLLYPGLKREDYKLIINIDHHYKNTEFGDINLVTPDASSVTQILYNIFKENDIEIDIKMAECLYTGLVTDSGRFQYINTTAQSHLMAAELISLGVDPIKIFRKVFLFFLSAVLSTIPMYFVISHPLIYSLNILLSILIVSAIYLIFSLIFNKIFKLNLI